MNAWIMAAAVVVVSDPITGGTASYGMTRHEDPAIAANAPEGRTERECQERTEERLMRLAEERGLVIEMVKVQCKQEAI